MRTFLAALGLAVLAPAAPAQPVEKRTLSATVYYDKVHGAWLGECAGNMFGLPYEMKFIEEPGPDIQFRPDYADGARSDDDTDIEYVYLHALEEHGIGLTYAQVAEEWKSHINRRVWVANKRARELMDEGVLPPETGHPSRNEKAWFNLSGQFTQELWGMICPGMPATAQRFGDKFAHVVVYGESVLAAHYFGVLYAEGFLESDVATLVNTALSALPPESAFHHAVADVARWHREHPRDWRAARKLLHDKYAAHWNKNSSVLNGAACTMALLYGEGDPWPRSGRGRPDPVRDAASDRHRRVRDDFGRTILLACMIGYDADCNAATTGGLLGLIHGASRLPEKWTAPLGDTYRNVTRDGLPDQERISDIAHRIVAIGEQVIEANGGYVRDRDGDEEYVILRQRPFLAPLDPKVEGDGRWVPGA